MDDLSGRETGDGEPSWELGGFYGEYVAFLDSLRNRELPSPTLRESRQSVEIADWIRQRKDAYRG